MQRLVTRQNDLTATGGRQDESGVAKLLH